MCGIAGICGPAWAGSEVAVGLMCHHMLPRGPDDGGVASFESGGDETVLGSRRLAIIDPSSAGRQPMVDPARGNAIVFNGMIYNYRELRAELETAGERFHSDCDTEVILNCYGRYGSAMVERLRGMFALAIWDASTGEVFLARDRLGIKPLYYALVDGRLIFGSQVKTLLSTGLVTPTLSEAGIRTFLSYGAVSDPLTIIDGVHAVTAGNCGSWSAGKLTLKAYWSAYEQPVVDLNGTDATPALREHLDEAVACHLISDVPLGVFLSGGLDSSILASLAARNSADLTTVSVAFEEDHYSEARYQRMVAERLGCDHVSVTLTSSNLLQSSDAAFAAMDQPSFDGLNTYAVSRAASESGLKVALSGLGADELFDGYGYFDRVRRLEASRRMPAAARRVATGAISLLRRGSRAKKLGGWLDGNLPRGASYELLRRLFLPEEVNGLMRSNSNSGDVPLPRRLDLDDDLWNQVSAADLTNYTKNVLLRDTDAMSMAVSLEVRVPYLDDELVRWTLSLPGEAKKGSGKAVLLAAVKDLIPTEVATRKKRGFLLPIEDWMRAPLREEVGELVCAPPAPLDGLLDSQRTSAVWRGFLEGRESWQRPWALYALSRWARDLNSVSREPMKG